MSYDPKQFAAEIVAMAVSGLITIEYAKKWWSGTYTLKKIRNFDRERDRQLHQTIADILFRKSNTIEISQTNQTTLEKVSKILETSNQNAFFVRNANRATTPFVLLLVSFVGMSIVMGTIVWQYYWIILIYIFVALIGLAILRTYTPEGCVIKNQILGFNMFLTATESDRMELIGTPPTKTPELYEKYLPYAIALGVEKQWSRQFASVFAQLAKQGVHYHPRWYHGDSFATFDPGAFTTQISNSLQSAVQSSGGGGRGGGSSGGGRGGGGGGSW
jgi:uncharacterized membrane protein